MNLKYSPNKITTEPKEITLNSKVTTLIGENGSGKSTILEQLLENYFDDEKSIISYSSGLNESFSFILSKKIDTFNKSLKAGGIGTEINSFYFSSEWVSLLIYFAYFLENGKVKSFLDNHQYFKDKDISLYFHIKNDTYKKIIIEARKLEINGEASLISSDFHKSLSYLLKHSLNDSNEEKGEINFEENINFTNNKFNNNLIKNFITVSDEGEDEEGNPIKLSGVEKKKIRNKKLLSFLGIVSKFILKPKDTVLNIGGNTGNDINTFSDGEFQLLAIYSLLDLFDGKDTIFLFDEVDSHLHYKNINLLWENLKKVKGKITTTTHIPDSILNNDIESIKLVENGKISEDNTANTILKRLENISDKNIYEIRLIRKIENIVLMDDEVDWLIFRKLVKRKLGNEKFKKLDNITIYKRSSSYNNTNEAFGKGKLLFVQDFKEINKDYNINTKNIFLICDRDKLPLTEIKNNLEVNIHRDFNNIKSFGNTKTYLLSWKRLEIENYLLSTKILRENNCFSDYSYGENFNLDNKEDIAILDCKNITHPLYKKDGFNEKKLDNLINSIPKKEISEDIEKMYNFIISNI